MLNRIRQIIAARALPPAVAGPTGLRRDSDFAPPQPGILDALFGWGSDGRLYEMSPEDRARLRPTYLKSERTIRNERIAARRAALRDGTSGPRVHSLPDGAPALPGHVPAPYSFDASQPDMSPEARGFISGIGVDGVTKPVWPEGKCNSLPEPEQPDPTPEIVDATAAMLSGGKRWSVRRPKK